MGIVITSHEQLFLDSLLSLFSDGRFGNVAAYTDYREATRAMRQEAADLLILDLKGITVGDIQFLLGAQALGGFRLVAVTDSEVGLPEGISEGVSRSDSGQILLQKIIAPRPAAASGPGRPRAITRGFQLSKREYEAASLVAKGLTNLSIAETMGIRKDSVKDLLRIVRQKLNCRNRVEIAIWVSQDFTAD